MRNPRLREMDLHKITHLINELAFYPGLVQLYILFTI